MKGFLRLSAIIAVLFYSNIAEANDYLCNKKQYPNIYYECVKVSLLTNLYEHCNGYYGNDLSEEISKSKAVLNELASDVLRNSGKEAAKRFQLEANAIWHRQLLDYQSEPLSHEQICEVLLEIPSIGLQVIVKGIN